MNQQHRFCKSCGVQTVHIKGRKPIGCLSHVFLSVVTVGFWVPIAFLCVGIGTTANAVEPYRCLRCESGAASVPDAQPSSDGISGFSVFLIVVGLLLLFLVISEIQQ